jgi:hypothetical protein
VGLSQKDRRAMCFGKRACGQDGLRRATGAACADTRLGNHHTGRLDVFGLDVIEGIVEGVVLDDLYIDRLTRSVELEFPAPGDG